MSTSAGVVAQLTSVGFDRSSETILDSIDWCISEGQRWVVLGANGCGKTTLARLVTMWEHPSRGEVVLLGERLGHTDVRALRRRVSLVSAAMADMVRPALTATEVVVCARFAALEPWWHTYEPQDYERAEALLADLGMGTHIDQSFGSLSSGERQRTLLARALMGNPEFLVLDEPSAGLDLGGREDLLARLERLAADPTTPPIALVTHHVEEIPPSFTHVLMIRDGSVLASGPMQETLNADLLSECFGIEVHLDRHHQAGGIRYSARGAQDLPVTLRAAWPDGVDSP
ncbi:MAG: ABC transporter ATP-binding protein [Microthrixaceae bacterium]